MSLPTYHKQNPCPKCGTRNADTTYISPDPSYFLRAPGTIYEEHLLRKCQECGYKWSEACLDEDQKKEVNVYHGSTLNECQ